MPEEAHGAWPAVARQVRELIAWHARKAKTLRKQAARGTNTTPKIHCGDVLLGDDITWCGQPETPKERIVPHNEARYNLAAPKITCSKCQRKLKIEVDVLAGRDDAHVAVSDRAGVRLVKGAHMKTETGENAITILDVAMARGARQAKDGSISGAEFDRLDLPFFAGCECCEESLAPYNSYPSTSGYIRCGGCVCGVGFATVQEFEAWCKREDEDEDA
jgi:hypothetical protein